MFVWIRAQLCTTGSCCHNPPVPPVQGQAIEPGNWTAFAKMSTRISSIEHLSAKTCLNSLGSSEILAGGCWMTWIENLKQVVNGCEWSVRNQFVFFNSEGGFYHYISTYVVYLFNCSFNINASRRKWSLFSVATVLRSEAFARLEVTDALALHCGQSLAILVGPVPKEQRWNPA